MSRRREQIKNGVIKLNNSKLDEGLIMAILERGSDVWIKRTKAGIVVLEMNVTKRQEIESRPQLKGIG
jgi:hypothetical protein